MSIHLCSGCGARMYQVGPHEGWRFSCPSCGAHWQIGTDGQIRRTGTTKIPDPLAPEDQEELTVVRKSDLSFVLSKARGSLRFAVAPSQMMVRLEEALRAAPPILMRRDPSLETKATRGTVLIRRLESETYGVVLTGEAIALVDRVWRHALEYNDEIEQPDLATVGWTVDLPTASAIYSAARLDLGLDVVGDLEDIDPGD